jgi:uncharacterized protein (TIGR03435 family)
MLMLQSLLEDRFQMRVHRETRETPVYALIVYKNGPKLAATREAECPTTEAAGPPCGQMKIFPSPAKVRMDGDRAPISELVRVLAVAARRPVLDRTALSGLYDIRRNSSMSPPVRH